MSTAEQTNRQQWLDQIRDQVRAAFNGPEPSRPSFLGDMITRETKQLTKPRVKVPEPPPGLNMEQRKAWRRQWRDEHRHTRWNCGVHATESGRPGRSIPLVYDFREGWILRRMKTLNAEHRRILKLLYKQNEPKGGHVDWLKWYLWGRYEMDGLNGKTKSLIATMIELQLCHLGNPYGWKGIMSEPWENFDVSKDSWRKCYAGHWQNISGILSDLDEAALWGLYE